MSLGSNSILIVDASMGAQNCASDTDQCTSARTLAERRTKRPKLAGASGSASTFLKTYPSHKTATLAQGMIESIRFSSKPWSAKRVALVAATVLFPRIRLATSTRKAPSAAESLIGVGRGADATVRFNAYAIYYRLNLFSNFTYFLDDPVNGDQFNQYDRRSLVGGSLTRSWSNPWSAGPSETTVGVQARADFIGDSGGTEATGRTRRYGVELANYYRLNRWLAFDGDVSFTHARYRDVGGSGNRIANSIGIVVAASATFGAGDGWFGAMRLRYFGPQPLTEDNLVRVPPSSSVHARMVWRAKNWDVVLDALNVFDRKNYDIAYFYTSRLPGEPLAGVDDIDFHPIEPLTLRASTTRRF